MTWWGKKKFEYGQLSRNSLALAVSLYYSAGYQGEKSFDPWDFDVVDCTIRDFANGGMWPSEPRLGLPDYPSAKLIITKDLGNELGFCLRVYTNDRQSDFPENLRAQNLEAKLRIEAAWDMFDLPHEKK